MGWIDLAHDRDRWRALEKAVIKLLSSMTRGKFIDRLRNF
jgi:hypothetical protein